MDDSLVTDLIGACRKVAERVYGLTSSLDRAGAPKPLSPDIRAAFVSRLGAQALLSG